MSDSSKRIPMVIWINKTSIKPFSWVLMVLLTVLPFTLLGQNYNVKTDRFMLNLSGSAGLVYSTNVSASGLNPVSDIYAAVGISVDGAYELSKTNRINLGIGAEYRNYFAHPEYSSSNNFLTLSPETRLALNVRVGEIDVEFSDQLRFSADPSNVRAYDPERAEVVDTPITYAHFDNTAQIKAEWDINKDYRADLILQRNDLIPIQEYYDYIARSEDLIRIGINHPFSTDFSAGVSASYAQNRYRKHFQNDSRSTRYGLNATWNATKYISFDGQIGLSQNTFKYRGNNRDTTNPSTWYMSLAMEHAVNRWLSYTVSFNRSQSYGYVSNLINNDVWGLSVQYLGFRKSKIIGSFYWDSGQESGGFTPEFYDRFSAEISMEFTHSKKIRSRLFYRYTQKDSNLGNRTYDQHQLGIYIYYDF
ncbi:MAG: hypothetical protein SFY80_05835 [Verrucomicrobiota bacterium]|nr:hypothetical protein [Verrucomicrobiota bacterium]